MTHATRSIWVQIQRMRGVVHHVGVVLLLLLGMLPMVQAATSPSDPARVLLVYNANWTGDENANGVQDSLEVANYFMLKHGVPAGNIIGVNCSDVSGYSNYATMYSEMILPIKTKLSALGTTNIDIITLSYMTPYKFNNLSLDNAFMAMGNLGATNNIGWSNNPYLEPNPTFGSDHGHFDHALYKFNSKDMYLTARLDGPGEVGRVLDLVDEAMYANRYASTQPGYYNGNVYVDSRGDKSSAYTDAMLAADPDVQSGNYGNYAPVDVNIAYAEHYVLASGLPLKWQVAGGIIGSEPGAVYSDGTSAMTAPKAFLYGGWYAYNTYEANAWEWLPGSSACDLNSSSFGYSIRGVVPPIWPWATQALFHGASSVCGVVDEPYTIGHTRPNILVYYMLNGYTFAEASCLANPSIGWVSMSIGDPLLAPFAPKTLVHDTQIPVFAAGSPSITQSTNRGNVVHVLVSDAVEPEVVRTSIDYGTTTAYGKTLSTTMYYRRQDFTFPDLQGATTYHYRVTVTDPAGNSATSADLTFTTPAETPYGGTAATIPGIVQCENFDEGGEGVGYHDIDYLCFGSNYGHRADTGVEILTDDGITTFWIHGACAGEWLKYSLNVTTAGSYTLSERVYDAFRGTYHIEIDDVNVTGPVQIPVINGWGLLTQTGVVLTAGTHVMRLVMDVPTGDGFVGYFDYIQFTLGSANQPPVASATATPTSGTAPLPVSFDGSASSDPDGSIVSYAWNFGDSATGSGATISHTYATTGTFSAVLTVTDNGGAARTVTKTITVTAPADTTPPVISAVNATSITASGATITWTTDEASDSQVQYSTDTSYGSSTTLNTSKVTSHSVNLSGLSANTLYHYRVLSRDAAGNLATGSDATFTTLLAPAITTQAVSQTVTAPATATFSVVASGNPTPTYQWQSSPSGSSTYTAISGATSASYTTGATSTAISGIKYRCVATNSAGSATSSAATLTVNAAAVAPTITTQSVNQTVTAPATATFSVAASGSPTPTYQWQSAPSGSSTYTAISGATSTSYTTGATSTAMSGTTYRCVATNSAGSATSTAATLTVNAASTATATFIAADTTTQGSWKGVYGADGYNVIGDSSSYPSYAQVSASGNPLYTWAASSSDVRAVQKAAVADRIAACWYTSSSFDIDIDLTDGQSHQVALYMLDWDAIARAQTVEIHDAGTGALLDTRSSTSFANGLHWVWSLKGHLVIRVIYSGGAVNAVISGLFFGGAGTVAPAITTQPVNQTVTAPATATFSVVGSGTPTPTYQWQSAPSGSSTYTAISGATSTSYTTGATSTSMSGIKYRCVATNSAGSATSTAATLTVNAASVVPAITTQPVNQTVTAPATATFSVAASGSPTPTYQWQSAPSGSSTYTAISGATSASYTTGATSTAMSGTKYRCVATNSAGNATSTAATLTVNATATPTASVAVGDAVISEAGPNPGTFIITLSSAPSTAVTIAYSLTGRARNGVDYVTLPTTATIAAGQTTATVTVTPIDDTRYEKVETVILTVKSGTGYSVGSPTNATLSIQDNEGLQQTSTTVSTSAAPTIGTVVTYTAPTNSEWPSDLNSTWTWGDGSAVTTVTGGVSAEHAFAAAGTYAVAVAITDPASSATVNETFSVGVTGPGSGGGGGGGAAGGGGGCGSGSGLGCLLLIVMCLVVPFARQRGRW